MEWIYKLIVKIVIKILWNVKVRNKIFSKLEVSNLVFHWWYHHEGISGHFSSRCYFKHIISKFQLELKNIFHGEEDDQ